jgi:hypothetical protein
VIGRDLIRAVLGNGADYFVGRESDPILVEELRQGRANGQAKLGLISWPSKYEIAPAKIFPILARAAGSYSPSRRPEDFASRTP